MYIYICSRSWLYGMVKMSAQLGLEIVGCRLVNVTAADYPPLGQLWNRTLLGYWDFPKSWDVSPTCMII